VLSRAWARACYRPSCDTFQRSGPSKVWYSITQHRSDRRSVVKSINITVNQYRSFLEQVRTDTLVLPNYDLDSGKADQGSGIFAH
jgi:hypothetical protein